MFFNIKTVPAIRLHGVAGTDFIYDGLSCEFKGSLA